MWCLLAFVQGHFDLMEDSKQVFLAHYFLNLLVVRFIYFARFAIMVGAFNRDGMCFIVGLFGFNFKKKYWVNFLSVSFAFRNLFH